MFCPSCRIRLGTAQLQEEKREEQYKKEYAALYFKNRFEECIECKDEKNNNEITSEIKALRLAAGVMTDWKIRQWISNTDTTDFFLRLTASCSYGSFSTLGNVWAFNIGLACGFEAWSLNLKRQAL